jgi:LysM repeat protein
MSRFYIRAKIPSYNLKHMSIAKRISLVLLPLAMILAGMVVRTPAGWIPPEALAAQAPTPFPTPTPNEAGEIIYTVQLNDTAWRIAALAGISLEELYALNGLQATDFLTPGMRLLLGTGGPTLPTLEPGQEPTSTDIPASPTPEQGSGEICALLFKDENGNARLDEGEQALAGGKVSVADAQGQIAGEATTESESPDEVPIGACFPDLPDGDYNVSGAVPEGYNPTTSMNVPVRLFPGNINYVEFGAQPGAAVAGSSTAGGGGSPLLGLLGFIFLAGAAGLAYYAARYNRKSPRSLR